MKVLRAAAMATALSFSLACAVTLAASPEIRAEPETQPAASGKDSVVPTHARATRSRSIALDPVTGAKALVDPGKTGAPLQVGFARPVAALGDESSTRAQLEWESLDDGGKVAAVSVASPGAAALRMGLRVRRLPAGTLLRFHGAADNLVFDVAAADIAKAAQAVYWSPVVEGDAITLEIESTAGANADDVLLSSPQVSHLETNAQQEFALPKAAASCNIDVMCNQATWSTESAAVARILFTDAGSTYLCSGTLVADKDTSTVIPYFLTANHCISTQASAASLQSYWFYRSTSCNSGIRGDYRTLAGGATLLYANATTDTSFMRLNTTPPAGVGYVGWSVSAAPALGSSVTGIHHPTGDLQKISFGNLRSYATCVATAGDSFSCNSASSSASTFFSVAWASGITESGSSGSALFLDNGRYLLGQLYGGTGTCTAPGSDFYGRFDVAYNAALHQWLGATSSSTPSTPTAVPAYDYSDLWWNPAESGWGLSLTQHSSNALYGAWYVYDASGRPTWVVMPGGTWTSASNFSGDVYATTGPDPTGAFNPSLVTRTRVGTASLAFSSSSQATLAYTINGVSGSRAVVRQSFGIPDTTTATSYGDLWWNASESGWGVSISQQYRTLFAVWYSYGPDGQPVWYVMPGGSWTGTSTYTGTLYRTSAAPTPFFGSTRFDAASVTRTAVGTLTLDFTSSNAATMSYTIDGVSGAKAITRQAF